MNKRRIEITAVRSRRTMVLGPTAHAERGSVESFASGEEEIISSEVFCSPELRVFIEALFESDGNSGRAAERLEISRTTFYSRLRRLGLPVKYLRSKLNFFRSQPSNRKR